VPLNLVKADIGVSLILCVAYSLATVNSPRYLTQELTCGISLTISQQASNIGTGDV
jgi:hypothetical protein